MFKDNVGVIDDQWVEIVDLVCVFVVVWQFVQYIVYGIELCLFFVVGFDYCLWCIGGVGVEEYCFFGFGVIVLFVE